MPQLMTNRAPDPIFETRCGLRRGPAFFRALLMAVCALAVTAGSGRAETTREYQLKAAFLYSFTKFIEWPPQRFADASAPIDIGVIGPLVLRRELERVVHGRKVNGRPVVIKVVTSVGDARGCEMVFVANGEEKQLGDALNTLEDAGVLTVGESATFAAVGGMINFVREADKVRFAINLDAAERAGLKLSAQLLKLATVVRDDD